jgi:YidC/Oxa1 family membrane protein insertase
MDLIADLFRVLLVEPMTNVLVAISNVFGGNFGIAIIIFTILMRFITWPLTSSQFKQSRAMQAIQPQLQELQKKYKGKDPKKYQAEMMAIYKEHGVNPLGCIFPMLVQMPIWIALYQVINSTLGNTPESLLNLNDKLYPIPFLHSSIPLENQFLIWNLAVPDPLFILPVLVGLTMFIQQKMITPTPPAGTLTQQQLQQQQTQQMMTWMMPLMFGYFTLNVPSGLGLYWFVSNLAGIVTQYFYMGRRVNWAGMFKFGPPAPAPAPGVRNSKQPAAAQSAGQPTAIDAPRAKAQQPSTSDVTPGDEGAEGVQGNTAGVTPGGDARRKRHGRRRGKR